MIRHDAFLRNFDPIINETVMKQMVHAGLHLHKQTNITKITTKESGPHDLAKPSPKTVHTDSKTHPTIEADTVLFAIGRQADTDTLNLDCLPAPGVELDKRGYVKVDEYQESATKSITSIGDAIGKVELTPVAIAAGRRLANRLYGPPEFKNDKLDYENIASVVFSHPPSGSVGLVSSSLFLHMYLADQIVDRARKKQRTSTERIRLKSTVPTLQRAFEHRVTSG